MKKIKNILQNTVINVICKITLFVMLIALAIYTFAIMNSQCIIPWILNLDSDMFTFAIIGVIFTECILMLSIIWTLMNMFKFDKMILDYIWKL